MCAAVVDCSKKMFSKQELVIVNLNKLKWNLNTEQILCNRVLIYA